MLHDIDNSLEDPQARHWHLDKRVNITHLIATLSLAAGIFAWATAIDKRVLVLEERIAYQRVVDEKQDATLDTSFKLAREEVRGLREDLRETVRKLDRVVEILNGQFERKRKE